MTIISDMQTEHGKHGFGIVKFADAEYWAITIRPLPDKYKASHYEKFPNRDYNVVFVNGTWFRTAPNFRQIIASENPVARAFEEPREPLPPIDQGIQRRNYF